MFKAAEHTQSYSVTDSPLKDSTYGHTDGDNDHAEVTEEKAASVTDLPLKDSTYSLTDSDNDHAEVTEEKAVSANSDFVGVYGNERCHQKWEAKIKVAGTVRTLGRFDTQEEAAREFFSPGPASEFSKKRQQTAGSKEAEPIEDGVCRRGWQAKRAGTSEQTAEGSEEKRQAARATTRPLCIRN